MCYRYVLHLEALQALAEYLAISRPGEWRSRYNLAPGQQIPVVRRQSAAEAREIVTLRWLDSRLTKPGDLLPLLRPFPAGTMMVTLVTSRVNNLRHDDAACLEPADTRETGADQTLFSFSL
jgi:putative SOS response-associated peptidase YedK